jgi:hypothetical protein
VTTSEKSLLDNPKSLVIGRDSLIPVERDKLQRARLEIRRDDRGGELDRIRRSKGVNAK